ncbi:MAG: thioredoxin domain-containing protein [Planctomycetota bacterium]
MGKARQFLPALMLLFFVQRIAAGQQPLHWEATIDSAKAAASQSNRLVLVVFSAPWCTACHHLENEIRNQPGVAAALEANFVPVKINCDYYKNTAKQYGVTRLPTTVILAPSAQGEVLAVIEYLPVDQYLSKLNKVAADAKRRDAGVFAQIQPSPPVGTPAAMGQPPVSLPSPVMGQSPSMGQPPVAGATPPANIKPAANPLLGLDGFCPVQLMENSRWQAGKKAWGAIHRGRTYLFTGVEERGRFLADPDRYAPVSSGGDVVLLLEEGRSVSGFREHGLQFDGHIYLFADEGTLDKFRSNPRYYADRALQTLRPAAQTAEVR